MMGRLNGPSNSYIYGPTFDSIADGPCDVGLKQSKMLNQQGRATITNLSGSYMGAFDGQTSMEEKIKEISFSSVSNVKG